MWTRNITWQAPVLVLLTLPLWWNVVGRFLSPTGLGEFGNGGPLPSQSVVMEGVTFLQNRDGVGEWRLAADKVAGGDRPRLFLLTQPRLHLLGRGAGEDRLASRVAVYDTEKQVIDFSEQVLLLTGEGYELRTPELRYRLRDRKLSSGAGMVFTGSGLRLSGVSFQYDLQSGDFKVGERVACELW